MVGCQIAGYVLPGDPSIAQVQNETQLVVVRFGQIQDSLLLHHVNPFLLDTTIEDRFDSIKFLPQVLNANEHSSSSAILADVFNPKRFSGHATKEQDE